MIFTSTLLAIVSLSGIKGDWKLIGKYNAQTSQLAYSL
jgi:hypothetical protein